MTPSLPLLPTSVVGSHGLPGWVWLAREAVEALWKDFPTDKELGAGVVDVKAFKAESAQDVAARIRMLLQSVPPAQLWINPDCGFWETPRRITQQKLRAMVEGTHLVRKELGG